MYSITMNVGDSFSLGGNTVVQIHRANNDRIHLTIDTPKKVEIVRGETPDSVGECCQAWRDGDLSLREAADSCGMRRETFWRAVQREEGCAAP